MPYRSRILVIDQERIWRTDTARLLQAAGYRVYQAGARADGLPTLYQTRPDLILLGWSLSIKERSEIIAAIRDMTDAPILLLEPASIPMNGASPDCKDYVKHCAIPNDSSQIVLWVEQLLTGDDPAGRGVQPRNLRIGAVLKDLPPLRYMTADYILRLDQALRRVETIGEVCLHKRNGQVSTIRRARRLKLFT
ncbi:MAG: hypothetical protein M1132_07000 [Chloroflexi bacterium]|nr:hypothetical protein [Chloroflexota bacterium]